MNPPLIGPKRKRLNRNKPVPPRKQIFRKSHPQPTQKRFDSERRVVLFDLDGTLMKSSEAWEDCSRRALAELKLPVNPEVAFNAYRAIYECHASITGRIGPRGYVFEDVRQVWNTRTSYALLLAWAAVSANLLRTPQALPDSLLTDPEKSALLFKWAEEIREEWSIEYAPQIDRAIEEFRKGTFKQYLYEGADDLLLKLRDKGIEYNIATEGDLPTQWWKIRALGLDKPHRKRPNEPPLVKESQLLTTSQAARPRGALQALVNLSERYRGRAAASLEASKVDPPLGPQHWLQLEIASKASDLAADGLARMVKFFDRLASKISEDASGEVQPEFYTRVVYAINQAPEDPRHQLGLLAEFSKWKDLPRIRLAMVGDKHRSDVLPVRKLASLLGTKIMSVWVKQGKHGSREPEKVDVKDWLECKTLTEAGKFLLDDNAWQQRTEHIVEPSRLFFSVIEQARNTDERLDRNVHELLAGIGAARNIKENELKFGSYESTLEEFHKTVSDLVKFIVIDIRSTPEIRPQVIEVLKDLCRFDNTSDEKGVLENCIGLPKATIELLLSIAKPKGNPTEEFGQYLGKIPKLLNVQRPDWAAAVIEVLRDKSNSHVVDYICSDAEMSWLYYDQLKQLKKNDDFPRNFPWLEMDELFITMEGCVSRAKTTPPTPPPYQPRSSKDIIIGAPAGDLNLQQRIYLGDNSEGNVVHCLLSGPKIRNIVCVCGSPGSGKSSTLGILVLGAVTGEGPDPTAAPKSAVIAFHHELAGPSEFVAPAQEAGVTTKVFAFEHELENVRNEYPTLPPDNVMPLKFLLSQLSSDQIFRWIALPEKGTLLKKFREVSANKKSLKELFSAIETTPSLNQKERVQVQNGLKKLQSIIARSDETTIGDELKPGQLIVIDCGRGPGISERLLAWEIVVSVLERHWDAERKGEHFLLVFDEIHQIVSRNTESEARQLASRLGGLVDRMGRHQQVSILAASQNPKDFKRTGDLWAAATVLLFHNLEDWVQDIPKGNLWRRAQQHRYFGDLGRGQAWYCSAGQEPDTVQVRRRT